MSRECEEEKYRANPWVTMACVPGLLGTADSVHPDAACGDVSVRHSWVVAPNRLRGELGFQFSSLETLRELFRAKGRLATDPKPISPPSSPGPLKRAG